MDMTANICRQPFAEQLCLFKVHLLQYSRIFMKKFLLFLLLPLLLAGSFVAVNEILPTNAEAARFGGGRSFGGGFFNRSAPAPAPIRQQSIPAQKPAGAAAGTAAMGGMGGMLGPLLAGTMLGALFMGGAFQGIGGMDILIIGLAAFFILRLLRSRRQQAEATASTAAAGNYSRREAYGPASSPWDKLRNSSGQTTDSEAAAADLQLPEGFDLEDFMKGAKLMFTRMQESWDKRDLDDIAVFTSEAVLQEIEEQATEDPTPSRTDIILINARLVDFKQNEADAQGSRERAVVYFEVLLRESQNKDTEEVREIWHFIRRNTSGKPDSWKLGALQQVN
jgi:predicted lipid-binding transport protein (Tim44 family)